MEEEVLGRLVTPSPQNAVVDSFTSVLCHFLICDLNDAFHFIISTGQFGLL